MYYNFILLSFLLCTSACNKSKEINLDYSNDLDMIVLEKNKISKKNLISRLWIDQIETDTSELVGIFNTYFKLDSSKLDEDFFQASELHFVENEGKNTTTTRLIGYIDKPVRLHTFKGKIVFPLKNKITKQLGNQEITLLSNLGYSYNKKFRETGTMYFDYMRGGRNYIIMITREECEKRILFWNQNCKIINVETKIHKTEDVVYFLTRKRAN